MNYIFPLIIVLFFTACGGGGGSSGGGGDTPTPTYTSGVAVDNYIKNATVCIDTNLNNICDIGEHSTTTDVNGEFSFNDDYLTDDSVIIAYDGQDINTLENFPYILKNIGSNKDSNGKVVLSSLTTLITDYKNTQSGATLDSAKTAIVNFLGSGIDNINVIEDVIANKSSQEDEFLRSLRIFQMVKKLNDGASVLNNYTQSAISFKAIVDAIIADSDIKHDDTTITTTRDGSSLNAAVINSSPVFLDIPTPNINGGDIDVFDLDFVVDPDNGTISYTIIGGDDYSLFEIDTSSTPKKLKFKNPPSFSSPLDSGTNNIYQITLRANNGFQTTTKTINITVVDGSTQEPTDIILTNSSIVENSALNTVIGNLSTTDSNANDTYTYSLVSGFGDNSSFLITTNQLKVNSSLNYENDTSYTIKINTNDGTYNFTKEFNITITDVADIIPILIDTNLSTIESNVSLGTSVGSMQIQTTGDSAIVEYEFTSPSSYFDINTTTGIIETNSTLIPDINTTYTIDVRARNSAGWSSSTNANISVVTVGTDIHEAPTLANETFNIYEKQNTPITIGTVTVSSTGGDAIDIYRFTGSNDEGNFSINGANGEITSNNIFNFEVKNSYTVQVEANNTNGFSSLATITIGILDVNEQPENTTIVNDINISYGLSNNLTFSIHDGDSQTSQTIIVTAERNNTNVNIGSITNSPLVNSGDIIVPLTGNIVGDTNITVVMTDDGGILNSGDDNNSFSFIVTVRNNGWKIYDDNDISNPTTPVAFDGESYVWDSVNLWYATVSDKILMPIKVLSSETYAGINLVKIADGHYYVNKNSYINDTRKTDIYNTATSYATASGGTAQVSDSEFNHDATHHLFVSRLVLDGDGLDTRKYTNFIGQNPSFVSKPDTNTSYAIAGGFTGSFVDSNNDGNITTNICATRYGEGWRIATSYEMGKKDNTGDGTDEYYIPAYLGTATEYTWSSTRVESDISRVWVIEPSTGKWKTRAFDSVDNQYSSRCTYNNF